MKMRNLHLCAAGSTEKDESLETRVEGMDYGRRKLINTSLHWTKFIDVCSYRSVNSDLRRSLLQIKATTGKVKLTL